MTLGEVLELAYGKALKEEERRPGPVPVFGSNGQVGWHDEPLAKGPGIIVGRKGNPGTVTWAPTDFFAIDTTFYVVPNTECRSLYFLFYALQAHDLPSLAADSAVPGLNRNLVYSNLQLIPPPAVLEAFDELVKPLFEQQHRNDLESHTLAALRDALLPKLIRGEMRVKNAARFLKERGL
jgi:type I restriction enzyme S subunit